LKKKFDKPNEFLASMTKKSSDSVSQENPDALLEQLGKEIKSTNTNVSSTSSSGSNGSGSSSSSTNNQSLEDMEYKKKEKLDEYKELTFTETFQYN